MLLSKLNSVGAIFISWPEAADVIHGIARRESVAKGPTEEREREREREKEGRPSFHGDPLSVSLFLRRKNMLRPRPRPPYAIRPAMHAICTPLALLADIYPDNASPTPYPLPVTPSRVLIAWTSYNVASCSSRGGATIRLDISVCRD